MTRARIPTPKINKFSPKTYNNKNLRSLGVNSFFNPSKYDDSLIFSQFKNKVIHLFLTTILLSPTILISY